MEQPKSSLTTVLNNPSQLQVVPQNLKRNPSPHQQYAKSEKLPEDLTVKSEKDKSFEGRSDSTCLLCDDCPRGTSMHSGAEALWPEAARPAPSAPHPRSCDEASGSIGVRRRWQLSPSQPPLKNLLSLLKAYYALNAQPKCRRALKCRFREPTTGCSEKVVEKMQAGQISVQSSEPSSTGTRAKPACPCQERRSASGCRCRWNPGQHREPPEPSEG